MSDIATHEPAQIDRDSKTGRFIPGNSGFGGRPKGSRNKLGEAFIQDLAECWQEHGAEALRRCATEEPAAFVRVIASLLPKDVNLNLSLSAAEFADRWQQASQLLGHDVTMPVSRRPLRTIKTIEHD
jgi:hypothetical protein